MTRTILILGAGIGGQVVANELRRRLSARHRVVLVEKDTRHAFAPSFLWVMTGARRPNQVARDVRRLLRPGIEVVEAEVGGIDVPNRQVHTTRGQLAYDYLVIALGAELAPDAIPGLAEAGHGFYTLDGATRLRAALEPFSGRTVAVVISALPYKCPGAPHEAAMLLADFFQRRRAGTRPEIHLFTPEAQPMPVAGPQLGEAVRAMLTERGIAFHPLHKLAAIHPDSRELLFDGQPPVRYDLLVAIPPHRAPQLLRDAGLAGPTGWVTVDRRTLATGQEGVFAIGDVTAIPIPGRWKPDVPLLLPKAGVFAHAQALVVARRIAAEIDGRDATHTFGGEGFCMLEAGGVVAGMAYGEFFAEPSPKVHVRDAGWMWHLGKVVFERWWLAPLGVRRALLRAALTAGSRAYGIPISL